MWKLPSDAPPGGKVPGFHLGRDERDQDCGPMNKFEVQLASYRARTLGTGGSRVGWALDGGLLRLAPCQIWEIYLYACV